MAFVKSTSTLSADAVTVPNLSGGDNGKIVRMTGSNTTVNALNTDTVTQLMAILCKMGDEYYAAGVVSGFTGLTPGAPYFLDATGGIISSPPTPSASTRALYIGFATNSTDIVFRPGIPVSGT